MNSRLFYNHNSFKKLPYIIPVLFLTCILFRPTEARNGAAEGLLLWFNVLLPTLLPFMILSDFIRRLHIVDRVCNKIAVRTGKNLYFLYPLLLGLLSGLPLGARLTAESVASGQVSRKTGQFLLTVCNNSSMMFLMGYVAEQQLQQSGLSVYFVVLVPLASLLSAFLCCLLFPAIENAFVPKHKPVNVTVAAPPALLSSGRTASPSFLSDMNASIMDSFRTLTLVGGFVILFSVCAGFITASGSAVTPPLTAFLEITTGIRSVCMSTLPLKAKTILSAAAVSFTGLSGIAQTACVLTGTELSVFQYIISRIFSACICGVLFALFL